jgi:hypothetical protein
MALGGTTVWEVQTGGDDTNGGGCFDPGKVSAGGFTDGAATVANTASPVFTSASYNFVAGDVGAWLFIAAGTNWTKGWYQIASVASNAATLSAAVGAGILPGSAVTYTSLVGQSASTLAGCATTASPTGATWSIDYSQQAAAQFTYTDLVSAGTGLTVSSVLKPFGRQYVGNGIVITGGTNFNAGRYVIASVAAGTFVATVVGPTNITTGAGASGTGGQGGALASMGKVVPFLVNNNYAFVKSGTYTITTATGNVATGCISGFGVVACFVGYSATRTIMNTGTKPLVQYQAALSTATFCAAGYSFINLALDGANQTAAKLSSNSGYFWRCSFTGFNTASSSNPCVECTATANSATIFGATAFACEAYANTATPFGGSQIVAVHCLSYNNTGASTDGFTNGYAFNCVSYGNGRHGFHVCLGEANCHAENNAGWGFTASGPTWYVRACSGYNNTLGLLITGNNGLIQGMVDVTSGSPLTNPGSSDFSTNATALRGALLRSAGIPGAFPRGLTAAGYPDIGAVRHADPAAGAVAFVFA